MLAVLIRVMQEGKLFKQVLVSWFVPNPPSKVCLQHKASCQSYLGSSPSTITGSVGLVDPAFFSDVVLVRHTKWGGVCRCLHALFESSIVLMTDSFKRKKEKLSYTSGSNLTTCYFNRINPSLVRSELVLLPAKNSNWHGGNKVLFSHMCKYLWNKVFCLFVCFCVCVCLFSLLLERIRKHPALVISFE